MQEKKQCLWGVALIEQETRVRTAGADSGWKEEELSRLEIPSPKS